MPKSSVEFQRIHNINEPRTIVLHDALLDTKNIELSILRLDEVHPEISGNKFYKLVYFLEEAARSSHKTILTFGGAYSNHLAATAFACRQSGITCIGIVRGEEPNCLSPTLSFCLNQGMHLVYISREKYKSISDQDFLSGLEDRYGKHILVPEGGFSEKGAKGASLITGYFEKNYSHICLAVGTATTFAGILNGVSDQTKVVGIDVIKNRNDINDRMRFLQLVRLRDYELITDYHFGGYAKKTEALLNFMNEFYSKHAVPLDFVYTGKMMFGVYDMISKNYFPKGSKILCLHTGGLQGNKSLPTGRLNY